MSLTRMARELDMRTIVVDGRERYATRERFPDADEIRVGMPSEIVAAIAPTKRVAVVLIAHDYKYELPVLRALLRSPVGYIGMLGSKKRGDAVRASAPRGRFHRRGVGAHPYADRTRHRRKEPARGRRVDPRRARRGAQREACVTAFRAIVLEHFRHPRNRGPLDDATASAEGANPLCGDRIRVQVRVDGESDRRCALHGRRVRDLHRVGVAVDRARARDAASAMPSESTPRWIHASLEGEPPPGRAKCCDAAARHVASRDRRVGRRGTMIAGLLLAAGGARRFGSQKLVATLDGVPLVRHAAEALAHETDELIVVVGSEAAAVTKALDGIDAGSSRTRSGREGCRRRFDAVCARRQPGTTAIVVALGDEPRVDGRVCRALIATWRETGRPIVVARYAGEIGHPDSVRCVGLRRIDGARGRSRRARRDSTLAGPCCVCRHDDGAAARRRRAGRLAPTRRRDMVCAARERAVISLSTPEMPDVVFPRAASDAGASHCWLSRDLTVDRRTARAHHGR